MKKPPIPTNDSERVAALEEYKILDTPYENIFDTITKLASSICGTPISLISLVDGKRQWFKSLYGMSGVEIPRDISFCAHALVSDADVFEVADAAKDKRFQDNPSVLNDPHIRFYAGVPLTNPDGYKLGTLCVIDRKPNELTPKQKEDLEDLSKIVMALFESRKNILRDIFEKKSINDMLETANAKLEYQIHEQHTSNDYNALLTEMNEMLQSCNSHQEAFMVIEKYGRLLFPYSSGTLYLIDPSHEYFDHRISWNQPEATDDIFLHEDCWALRIGAFYQVSDPAHDLVCKHFRKEQTSRYFCLPLTAQSETIGLLCIEHNLQNEHDRHIVLSDDSRRMLAVRMSDQIALSIANIKLRETLRIQSTRDPLTGLFNRRYLAEVMRRELPRAERKDVQLGVILIDIDFFKKFNDTYGHDTGDLVLTSLADIFTRVTRKTDIVSRLGGEEFLIILRDTTKAKLLSYLENLQAEVRKLDLHYAGRSVGKITFSAGVSMFPEHGNYMESLVNAADGALYKAKEAGRNRFVFAVDEQIVKEKG